MVPPDWVMPQRIEHERIGCGALRGERAQERAERRRRREGDRARRSRFDALGRKPNLAGLEVDFAPPKAGDFGEARAGEEQREHEAGNGSSLPNAGGVGRNRGREDRAQLVGSQEANSLARLVDRPRE